MRTRLAVAVTMLAAALAFAQTPERPAEVAWVSDNQVLIGGNGLLARFALNTDQQEVLDDSAVAFALGPDRHWVAVARPEGVELRHYPEFTLEDTLSPEAPDNSGADTRNTELVPPPSETNGLTALAWAPTGGTLAGGTEAGHVLLWDVESRELWGDVGVEPPAEVISLSFSSDGARLLSSFADGRAILWDIEKREVVGRFSPPHEAAAPATTETEKLPAGGAGPSLLSPDGKHVLMTRRTGEAAETTLVGDHGNMAWQRAGLGVGFTPDSTAVLTLAPPFRIAALYRVADAGALRTFEPPEYVRRLYTVRASPDGAKLLGVGETESGQALLVWDLASGRLLESRRTH